MKASCRRTPTRCSNAACISVHARCRSDAGVLTNDPSSSTDPVATAARHRTKKSNETSKPCSAIFFWKPRISARASGQMLQTWARARSAFVSGVPARFTRLKISTTSSTPKSSPVT